METLEKLAFVAATILVGVFLLIFIRSVNYNEAFSNVRDYRIRDDQTIKTTKEDFAEMLYKKWQDCGYGELEQSYALVIEDQGTISRAEVIAYIRKNNNCYAIGCDENSKLNMSDSLDIPKVINIRCTNNTLVVS